MFYKYLLIKGFCCKHKDWSMHLNRFSLLSSWINMYFITISKVYIPVNIYEIILSGKLRWKKGEGVSILSKHSLKVLFYCCNIELLLLPFISCVLVRNLNIIIWSKQKRGCMFIYSWIPALHWTRLFSSVDFW